MRTFTQEELNRFIINHMQDIKRDFNCTTDIDKKIMFANQALSYTNMAVVFASADIYNQVQDMYNEMVHAWDLKYCDLSDKV